MSEITDEMIEAFGHEFWVVNSASKIDANREEIRAGLKPALTKCRLHRAGENLHKKAKDWGWLDDGEGAFEFIQRVSYEQGLADARTPETER